MYKVYSLRRPLNVVSTLLNFPALLRYNLAAVLLYQTKYWYSKRRIPLLHLRLRLLFLQAEVKFLYTRFEGQI